MGVLLSGVRAMGILSFAGLTPLIDLLAGRDVRPAPEAQGPPLGSDEEVVKAGAFRFSRHPGNLGALGFFLFLPRMTANRAVLLVLVGLYVILGSILRSTGFGRPMAPPTSATKGGVVSGPRAPKRLGTYNRLIQSPASFQRHQRLELPYRPGQGNRGLP